MVTARSQGIFFVVWPPLPRVWCFFNSWRVLYESVLYITVFSLLFFTSIPYHDPATRHMLAFKKLPGGYVDTVDSRKMPTCKSISRSFQDILTQPPPQGASHQSRQGNMCTLRIIRSYNKSNTWFWAHMRAHVWLEPNLKSEIWYCKAIVKLLTQRILARRGQYRIIICGQGMQRNRRTEQLSLKMAVSWS